MAKAKGATKAAKPAAAAKAVQPKQAAVKAETNTKVRLRRGRGRQSSLQRLAA